MFILTVFVLLLPPAAMASDATVDSTRLVIEQKNRRALVTCDARDTYRNIFKGTQTDRDDISARFYMLRGDSAFGRFTLPEGSFAGGSGWDRNSPVDASYRNDAAPGGPTQANELLIINNRSMQLEARSMGDQPMDLDALAIL